MTTSITNILFVFFCAIVLTGHVVNAFNLKKETDFHIPLKDFGFDIATKIGSKSEFIVTIPAPNNGSAMHCDTSKRNGGCTKLSWDHVSVPDSYFGISAAYGSSRSVVGSYRRTGKKSVEKTFSNAGRVFQFKNTGIFEGSYDPSWKDTSGLADECSLHPCETGSAVGVLIIDEEEWVIAGAPGSYHTSAYSGSVQSFKAKREPSRNTDAKLMNSAQVSSLEASRNPYSSYLGYSINADGDLNYDGKPDVVAGAPRLDYYLGAAVLFNGISSSKGIDRKPSRVIRGNQMGAYFGASTVVADFDYDGQDDLCVGAPQYVVNGVQDIGHVKCYFEKFTREVDLYGNSDGERFGFSSAAGDFDSDGYKDLVVGAPFFNKSLVGNHYRGRIFIFNGNNDGLIRESSQTIYGQTTRSRFGYSLDAFAPGTGLNILVGAPGEARVFLFTPNPVASIIVEITTDLENDRLRTDATSFQYTITFTNPSESTIPANGIQYYVNLDSRLTSENSLNHVIDRDILPLESYIVYFPVNVLTTTKFTVAESYTIPLILELSWENSLPENYSLYPGKRSRSKEVVFNTDCGKDVCHAALKMDMRADTVQVVAGDPIKFTVLVKNTGPNIALRSRMRFTVYDNLKIKNFHSTQADCFISEDDIFITCNLKNMNVNETSEMTVSVDTSRISEGGAIVEAEAITISRKSDPKMHDESRISLQIKAITYADATITGMLTGQTNDIISSTIIRHREVQKHTYFIRHSNIGFSTNSRKPPITQVKLDIYWPFGFLYPTSATVSGVLGDCNQKYIDCLNKEDKYKGEYVNATSDEFNCLTERETSCVLENPNFPKPVLKEAILGPLNVINCTNWSLYYVKIECNVKSIASNEASVVSVGSLPNTDFLENGITGLNPYAYTLTPSFAIISAKSEEKIVNKQAAAKNNFATVMTYLKPAKVFITPIIAEQDAVPLWLVIVVVCLALILVMLVLVSLHKFGFFNRNRVPQIEPYSNNDAPMGIEDPVGV